MAETLISELLATLDRVGTVYRSRDNSKPADAIQNIKDQLAGYESLTISQWIERKKSPLVPAPRGLETQTAETDDKLLPYIDRLRECECEAEIASTLNDLSATKPSAAQWIAITKSITGRKEKSGIVAQRSLQSFLAARVLRQNSRSTIDKVFKQS